MIKLPYSVDIISPLFLGGASPQDQAEIRAPSIRGQLRWWFRVLGGFRTPHGESVRAQENAIFGTAAGDEGLSGQLIVRVSGLAPSHDVRDDQGMEATIYDPKGYLLFPLRTERDGTRKSRAVFNASASTPVNFQLDIIWKGTAERRDDLHALLSIFIQLGSLGFRGRRAMGALAPKCSVLTVAEALKHFNSPDNVLLKGLPGKATVGAAIDALATWLKNWRSHGRTGKNEAEQNFPGFKFAKSDHDAAIRNDTRTRAYRPALGLPVMTKYGNWGAERPKTSQPVGRFASPVILRPHRLHSGEIVPLIIFVEKYKWPDSQPAYRKNSPVPVTDALYDAMKRDDSLSEFKTH